VTDYDVEIARKSVQILCEIAISVPNVAQVLLPSFLSFYKAQKPHLINEAITGFTKILKKFPGLFTDIKNLLLSIDQNLIN
jgi:hypothetical protein